MIYIDILFTIISVFLLIPTLVIFVQILSARLLSAKNNDIQDRDISIAVLIPAHNESTGIIATLNSIKSQLKSAGRILVVADNCSDDTAKIASANGVEVLERQDKTRIGKGFALDFGIRHLSKQQPEVVVIMDADCTLQANSLNSLANYALQSGRPVQSLYLMHASTADLKSRIAEFAWCVKNWVRPLGYAKLGLPCQLMGTGMAFPWKTIASADLANGSIVEDMKLGLECALTGLAPTFLSGSQVSSYFPATTEVQSGQRTRWEHGHLSMIISETPRLFAQALTNRDKNLLAMALDLSVPPLALLVVFLFSFIVLTGTIFVLSGYALLAFQITLVALIALTIAMAIAWYTWGKNIISLSSILLIPVYVVSKIPHYFKFLFKRQKAWNKTERDQV